MWTKYERWREGLIWYNDQHGCRFIPELNVAVRLSSDSTAVKRMDISSLQSIGARSLDTTALKIADKTYNGRDDDAQISGLAFSNLPDGAVLSEGHRITSLRATHLLKPARGRRDDCSYTYR